MENYLIINSEQLSDLLRLKKKSKFKLALPDLTDEENDSWTKRIKNNYFACGCQTGTNFIFCTLLFLIVALLFKRFLFKEELYIEHLLYSIALIFLMGIVGKLVGKRISYLKLKRDIDQLKAKVEMNCHQQTYLQKHG